MTEAQNESFPIPAPWTIMKTEDATNFIHLRDTYCDRIEGCGNIPIGGGCSSQTHSYCMLAETWYHHFSWDSRHGRLSGVAEFLYCSWGKDFSRRINTLKPGIICFAPYTISLAKEVVGNRRKWYENKAIFWSPDQTLRLFWNIQVQGVDMKVTHSRSYPDIPCPLLPPSVPFPLLSPLPEIWLCHHTMWK